MSCTEFTVVRHGQTIANKTGTLQGQTDTPLDDTGIAQAQAAADALKNAHFDVILSSDLGRAMATAAEIAKYHHGVTVIPDQGLREWDLGDLQGKTYAELNEKYPEVMAAFKSPENSVVIPGGENFADFQKRISAALERIAAEYPGKKILLVSHGGATQRMFCHVAGCVRNGNVTPLCANASISAFRKLDSGAWQLTKWSETGHLAHIVLHETLTY